MNSPSPASDFSLRLAEAAGATDRRLDRILTDCTAAGETFRPARLMAAMRHAVLSGGKRFRPFLLIESAGLFAVPPDHAVRAAAALECLHTYSLVHDDLPAMDDDDLRRGVPTVHKAFDEATAILAGDGLLTLAFAVLADPQTHADPAIRAELVHVLARAAGPGGMVGGQMLDLRAEHMEIHEEGVRQVQDMKTGALMAAACEMGAVLGRASTGDRASVARFGRCLGLAFQIADDLIDATGDAGAVGKATGKDAARGKATFVAVLGVHGAANLLARTIEECREHMAPFGDRAATLIEAARFAAERRS